MTRKDYDRAWGELTLSALNERKRASEAPRTLPMSKEIEQAIGVLRKDGHAVAGEGNNWRVHFYEKGGSAGSVFHDDTLIFEARRIMAIKDANSKPEEPDPDAAQDSAVDAIRRYTSDIATLLRKLDPAPILQAINALYEAHRAGKVVLFCGNGGSGASCSHIVNDFVKGCRIKAICLNDCIPLVSSIANDISWHDVFIEQVSQWIDDENVLVAVSGSGNSTNILQAVGQAKYRATKTIGLSGFDGGQLKALADISIHIPTNSMQQAEDVHMIILHMLFLGLQKRIDEAQ